MIKIGILNFSEIGRENSHMDSIQELIEFAQLSDKLGFSRFWLSEQYLYRKPLNWTNPEMLIPILSAATEFIKIGIAGSLITVHPPIDIATNFKLLANLFPERIDLGFAKGGAQELGINGKIISSAIEAEKLFYENAKLITSYLEEEDYHYNNGLVIPPLLGIIPETWLLGTSYKNINKALELGTNFSRSIFHLNNSSVPDLETLVSFQDQFQLKFNKPPKVNLAVAGCCHQNLSSAKRLVNSYTNTERIELDHKNNIYGDPQMFYDKICILQESYNIDEIILMPLYKTHKERMKGIEIIAKACSLSITPASH